MPTTVGSCLFGGFGSCMTPKLNAFGDVGNCPVVGDFGDFGDFAPVCTPAGNLEPDFPAVDAFAPDGPALADFAFAANEEPRGSGTSTNCHCICAGGFANALEQLVHAGDGPSGRGGFKKL